MATFSAVTAQHILQAIAEHDSRGRDDFLGVYGFAPSGGVPLVHEGRTYDVTAVVGVAHRYATGRLATADEVGNLPGGAGALLRRRGFDVPEPEPAAPAPRASRASSPRTAAPRRAAAPRKTPAAAAPERVEAICPTCSMTLPATGVCDYCS